MVTALRASAPGREHLALYAFALALRLAILLRSGPVSGQDTVSYRSAADALAAAPLGAGDAFASLPPLLPVLMALLQTDVAVAITLAVVGSLIAPAAFALGRRLDPRAALPAGLLASAWPHFLQWSPYLLTETLGLTLLALALVATASTLERPGPAGAVSAGAAMGLALLARAALLAPAGAIFILLLTRSRRSAVVFILAGIAVLAIPTARNAVAIGAAVPYQGQTWLLLWAGTRWDEVGRGTTGVDLIYPAGLFERPPATREQILRDEYFSYVGSRPIEYAQRTVRKALWFWLPWYPEWSLSHIVVSGSSVLALYALSLIGLLRCRRSRVAWLLVTCALGMLMTAMLTIVDYDNRYRLPAELTLLPLAAAGLTDLARRISTRLHGSSVGEAHDSAGSS